MRRLAILAFVIGATTLSAAPPLTITTSSLPTAVFGQQYAPVTLNTSGDPGPLQWSIVPGSFSPGNPPPGFVAGASGPSTPTQGTFCFGFNNQAGSAACFGNVQTPVGSYTFTIQVFSLTSEQSAQQQFTLQVVQPLLFSDRSPLPTATANLFYSKQLMTTGGTISPEDPFAWSVINGTLPAGISLDPDTGLLSGQVSNAAVQSTFTVQATDTSTNVSATATFTIDVQGNVVITTTSVPNATLFQPYSFQFTATNASAYVWSVLASPPLPPTFTLSPSGVLTGSGNATGIFPFTALLTNPQGPGVITAKNFVLYITLGPLSIKETTLPPGATQNLPYRATLTAVGGLPPYAWSFDVPNPQGLTIDSKTGAISGTPPTAGTLNIPVTLRDAAGGVFSEFFQLNVGPALSITTTSLPNGSLSTPYFAAPTTIGGAPPFPSSAWTVIVGALPPGLSLNAANGQISGTPIAGGAFAFTLQVIDFIGTTAIKALTITIGTVQPLSITTTSLPGASLNQAYSQALATTGGTQPVTAWTITSGNLPAGLTLNPSTGVISGTPAALGSSSFTVQALDSAQQTASKTFGLAVASPVTISAAGFTASIGTAVSQTATAGGGVPPYTFSVSVGSLPAGLQIGASTGVISGTPNANGIFPMALRATDNEGRFAEKAITVTISSPTLTIVIPAGTVSGQQPGIGVSISAPTTGDINGTLTLAFVSSVGGTDNMVRFAPSGLTSIAFTIPKGSTAAPNATVITGTVAGTITLTASVPGNADVIRTIVIAPAVPVITSVALQQVTGGVNVVVTGYSNTREVSSGSFTFTVSSGNTLTQATIPVTLAGAFAAWFGNTSSNATGGQFKLTVPFSVTQGSAIAVTKVSVTLTNGQGVSAAVASQ